MAARRSRLWRWRRPLFVIGFLGFAGVAGVLFYISRLPLPNPEPQTQTSFVYDTTGQQIDSYQVQNRVSVPYSSIPEPVIGAVVSTEDRHYFTEGALNPVSTLRALIADLRGTGNLQGGSTITQQYVKQAYLTSQRTVVRKVKEAAIAVKLERKLSKDQLLDDYLNTIYLGRGAYGVQAAAQAYFGENVTQLGLPQASLLAGLIREPDNTDPSRDPGLARAHQDDTLASMERDHRITAAQAMAVERMPFSSYVRPRTDSFQAGTTAVVGDQYYLTELHQQLVAQYGAPLVDGGGLRITATLDPALQAQAYNSIYGTSPGALHPQSGDPSGALVSMDGGGAVRAMVGGNGQGTAAQVNLALGGAAGGGGSGRQAGSTFKAFMLAELVHAGYSVQSTFPAPPEVVVPHGNANGTPWVVKNFEGEAGSNSMTLIEATAQSVNTVYAQVVERLGPQTLDTMAEALGISSSELSGAYPSQVLGTAAVSPLEMDAAYNTFAGGGVYRAPLLYTRVTRADGSALPLPHQTVRQVLSAHQAAVVTSVLRQVVTDGTGGAAGHQVVPVAGKTGTTDNSANAWFIGYTPHLTTAVWMGFPQGNVPMVHIRGLASIQGGTIPAELWHNYMVAVLRLEPAQGGQLPDLTYTGGNRLYPPAAGLLQFPEGLGTTTTVPATTTTSVSTSTVPTTRPVTTTVPATTTTRPVTTTTPPTTAH